MKTAQQRKSMKAKKRAAKLAIINKANKQENIKSNINNIDLAPDIVIQSFDNFKDLMKSVNKNNQQMAERTLDMNNRLMIDITGISNKNQNNFMDNVELRTPNPMDIITLHNEIIRGTVSKKHFGNNLLTKIDTLYSTLKSFIDCVSEYDNSIEFALKQK